METRETGERRRVVITGVGAVTALGVGVEPTFEGLCSGRNGIRVIPFLRDAGFAVHIGGDVAEVEQLLDRYPDGRRYGSRKLAYALAALDEALANARLENLSGPRTGIFLGVETSRLPFATTYRIFDRSGRAGNRVDYRKYGELCRGVVPRDHIQNKLPSFLPRYLAARLGVTGPALATSNACSSSNYALGEALRRLRAGRLDVVVAGSADEMLDEYMVTGFSLLGALATDGSDPGRALKPFDARRRGFVLGEGGAMLVLETLEHAEARRAPILAELVGFGSTSDGEKITACHRKGAWLAEAMRRALADGGVALDEVDYVNAHGTSTQLNDLAESRAIMSLFGERAGQLLVNSTKSMLGHTVAAAGAIEAAVTVLSLQRSLVHPTRNLEHPDDGCDLNYCAGGAVRRDLRAALSNSCGFSGGNSCLAFRKWVPR